MASPRSLVVLVGVVFTATHLNLARFDNELRFRGDAHRDLARVLRRPEGAAGAALRAADACPTTSSCPTRAGSPTCPYEPRARARADAGAPPQPTQGRRDLVTSRFAIFKHALDRPERPAADPGAAARLRARRHDAILRRVCPLLSAAPRRGAPLAVGGVAARRRRARRCGSWGVRHGLPYVYNADENAHFVPRAIGMFGHSLEPELLRQPAGVHVPAAPAFCARAGAAATAVGDAFAADPTHARSRSRARCRGAARRAGRRRCWRGRARGCSTARVGLVAGGAAGGRVPARALLAPRAQRRADAGAAVPVRWSASPAIYRARPAARLRARGRRRSGSPARPSTRPGSCCCRSLAAALVGPGRARPRGWRGLAARGRRWRWRASWSPTRTRCSTSTRSATGSRSSRRRRATAAASSASPPTAASSTTSGRSPGGSAGCPRSRALGGAVWLAVRDRAAGAGPGPRAAPVLALHGPPGPLLRALAAAGLSAAVPARGVRRARGACWRVRARPALRRRAGARCCARRASSSPSTTTACSPAPTRASSPATGWSRNVPTGSKVVVEPIAPDQWAMRRRPPRRGAPATATAGPSGRTSRSRSRRHAPGGSASSSSRTTSARCARRWSAYARGGYCWV